MKVKKKLLHFSLPFRLIFPIHKKFIRHL